MYIIFTKNSTLIIGVIYRSPNIGNEGDVKLQKAIMEVSKGGHVPSWEISILNLVKKNKLCKIVLRLFQLLPRIRSISGLVRNHILG